GSEAWRLVELAVREHAHRTRGQILHGDPIAAAIERHKRQPLAVGRNTRASIVARAERNALDTLWIGNVELIDLRAPGAVGGEVDAASIRTPDRLRVDGWIVGQLPQLLRAQVEHPDVEIAAAARKSERELSAIGRELRRRIDPYTGRHQAALAGAHPLH